MATWKCALFGRLDEPKERVVRKEATAKAPKAGTVKERATIMAKEKVIHSETVAKGRGTYLMTPGRVTAVTLERARPQILAKVTAKDLKGKDTVKDTRDPKGKGTALLIMMIMTIVTTIMMIMIMAITKEITTGDLTRNPASSRLKRYVRESNLTEHIRHAI